MATGLATRCPACGTVFRVVPDQLRVSEGWVRCGRCSEVFNATQSLVDLDTAVQRKAPAAVAPPPALPPAPPPPPAAEAPAAAVQPAGTEAAPYAGFEAPVPEAPTAPTARPAPTAPDAPAADEAPSRRSGFGALDAGNFTDVALPTPAMEAAAPDESAGDGRREPSLGAAPSPTPRDDAGSADLQAPPSTGLRAGEPSDEIVVPGPAGVTAAATTAAAAAADIIAPGAAARPAADGAGPAAKPEFLRRAERAERWRRPGVRASLLLGLLLGIAGLVGQVLHEYRDLAAARYPQLRPLLEQGCAWLDCRVGAARAIDSLAVESSGLVRVENSELYRLSVVLRNRSGIALALPALDLALTDRQGRLIARKVLRAGELGAAGETLDAGAEATLAATLRAGNGPVAGYTVELFYP